VNEILQQFLIESRELVDAASAGIAALEGSPGDLEPLNEVFRAFHTLKGGAGIVQFAAMEGALHEAEDLLAEARAGERALTAASLGSCLACLDRVAAWLDDLERTGQLPEATASQAEPARPGSETTGRAPGAASPGGPGAPGWLATLLTAHPEAASRAVTAARFVPAGDCLYKGQDPLARMMSLPGLLALQVSAREPWGPLEALDPFRCNLALTALSAAGMAEVQAHLDGQSGPCEILAVPVPPQSPGRGLPARVAAMIEAQQALLAAGSPRDFPGRVASAGRVAANALRFCGEEQIAERVSQATEESLAALSPRPLQQLLAQLLCGGRGSGTEPPEAAAQPQPVIRTLRIDAGEVDALVRLTGELTVLSNGFAHLLKLARAGDPLLAGLLQERHGSLGRLVGQLQSSVLRLRVLPLRTVLQRLPRLAREMAGALGKSVELAIEGGETQADKAIIEMLFEPLLHLVRNAIDHGVESAGQRAAAGKALTATVRIRAQRRADQVLIEVSDDGAGIDLARVRELGAARGLVGAEQLPTMTDAEALELIFAPGFSTTADVTQVSGRGVGMDAVRRAVERVGGHVSVASVQGRGTEVTLSLPFSVMMTQVMTVEASGQMFGLPLEAIIETVRVPTGAISRVGALPVVVLRERTLPLIDLGTVLGVGPPRADEDGATLIVAAANGEWGAFRVDRILERLDLIMKPLEGLLAGTPGVMGTTLLGDGSVLLVLDVGELLR
jgi:two-component system chemotaxis sensor kinase CheA